MKTLANPIVRALTGDLHIMHMAFLETRTGDPHELAVMAHLFDRGTAGIAHRGPQPPHKLMDHASRSAFVGHLALDTLGHQLVTGGILLKIAIRRTARHCAQTSHAAIGLERPPLI